MLNKPLLAALAVVLGAHLCAAQTPGGCGPEVPCAGPAQVLPSPKIPKSGIIPALHLAKMQASSTPTICIVGDSTSTVSSANNITPMDLLWGQLQRELRAAYPSGKTFTFDNYAISGTTLVQFTQTMASGWPSWWTNHSQTWAQAVASAATCTTLFINFGVNDPGFEPIATWITALNDIMAWGTTPDIIIITNAVANPAAGSPYNLPASQYGYISNGGMARSLAANYSVTGIASLPPIGLIDINRYFLMSVDGIDPVDQYLYLDPNAPGGAITSFPYSFDMTPGGDFDLQFTFSSGSALQTAGTVITVSLGDGVGGTGGFAGNQVNFETTNGTNCFANYYGATGSAITAQSNVWTSGAIAFRVTAKGDHMQFWCNGALINDLVAPRYVGPFIPTITLNSAPASPSMTVQQYAFAYPQPYAPSIQPGLCYGLSTGLGPSSGNGINHDASTCLNLVYRGALEATTFR